VRFDMANAFLIGFDSDRQTLKIQEFYCIDLKSMLDHELVYQKKKY